MHAVAKMQRLTASSLPQLAMPPNMVEEELGQEGCLFLEQRSTGRQYNISSRLNVRNLRTPFHLSCILPVSEEKCLRAA